MTVDNIRYVYENVEKTVVKSLNEVPEELKQKKAQHEKVQAELQNLLNFIRAGNFSKVVSEAIIDVENRSDQMKGEMKGLDFQKRMPLKPRRTLTLLDESKDLNWLHWRKERDSNPRYPYEYSSLAGMCLRPLSHLSKKTRFNVTRKSAFQQGLV